MTDKDMDSLLDLELTDLLTQEDDEIVVSDIEPSDDTNVDSEASQTSQDGDSESDSDDTTTEEQTTELAPLDDRLKELGLLDDSSSSDTLDDASDAGVVKRLETEIQQLEHEINQSPLNNLPKGGVYDRNGKWVFHMTESEINDYLTELKDNGQEFAAAQVQTAVLNALAEVPRLQARYQVAQQKAAVLDEKQQTLQWKEFKAEIQRKLPEMTQDDFDRIGDYVDNMAMSDPMYAQAIRSKEGKVKMGADAAKRLGIINRLKQSSSTTQQLKPSAPDASANSKRVKSVTSTGTPTYKRSQVENMSQAEFNRLPDNVVDLLLKGENIIDD